MAAPVYGKKWYEKSEAKRKLADKQMAGAVMTARAGSDDAIKQVRFFKMFSNK
jgi:hypothetical protein